jgi:hypothetical protein
MTKGKLVSTWWRRAGAYHVGEEEEEMERIRERFAPFILCSVCLSWKEGWWSIDLLTLFVLAYWSIVPVCLGESIVLDRLQTHSHLYISTTGKSCLRT